MFSSTIPTIPIKQRMYSSVGMSPNIPLKMYFSKKPVKISGSQQATANASHAFFSMPASTMHAVMMTARIVTPKFVTPELAKIMPATRQLILGIAIQINVLRILMCFILLN